MPYHHPMPFGAQPTGPDSARLRLWAPTAGRVEAEIETADGPKAVLPMQALADGWYECEARPAPPGTLYAFRIDGELRVPDPASRFNPQGVHGPSAVVDPLAFDWEAEGGEAAWRGRPWEEAVIYELHVGAFTPEGTFAAVIERLDELAGLGITAIELMPVAAFPGSRGWGYDGVLPFAPLAAYGPPDDLKRLVRAAHARGLMVFLDVVYNHFGPEGNYLHRYAARFFNPAHHTPWGDAINFDGDGARTVRDFFIHNALFWLEEYRFDGLRVDAVHAIRDDSDPDIVTELAAAVRAGPGAERHLHLVLENDDNAARYLARKAEGKPPLATAQWNDDFHHAAHALVSGERDGYYGDFAERPLRLLGRCLAEGFAWQGDASPYRGGVRRGEPSAHLPPTAFVDFLQNHDQIGNRALGERLATLIPEAPLAALASCLMLAPAVPLLFMGEEYGARTPFLYFCDFGPDLAAAVTRGRREEFARFARFASAEGQATIPDPNDPATFEKSRLDRREAETEEGRAWLARCRGLLALRRAHLVPRLAGATAGRFETAPPGGLSVSWALGDGSTLHLLANLAPDPLGGVVPPPGRCLHASAGGEPTVEPGGTMPPWAVYWMLETLHG